MHQILKFSLSKGLHYKFGKMHEPKLSTQISM